MIFWIFLGVGKWKNSAFFCGEKPVSKSKEHVLPRWLLEITGDPKRSLKLPFPYSNPEKPLLEMSFDALHFPACEQCNTDFSETEGRAKSVVSAMLAAQPIKAEQVSLLLDWLDKVRVGLWLGFLYLEKNPFGVAPTFHIDKRTATKDRMLVIYRANDNRIGLHLIGVNVPMFHHLPSCFTLVINDLYFFNVSADFLFSRRIGFPFPDRPELREDGLLEVDVKPGRERVMLPLLRLPIVPNGTEIYQPMYRHETFQHAAELYDNEYVRRLSLDPIRGLGKPMIIRNDQLEEYPGGLSSIWSPLNAYDRYKLHELSIRQTLKVQAKLWDYLYETKSKNVQKIFRFCKNLNMKWHGMDIGQLSKLS